MASRRGDRSAVVAIGRAALLRRAASVAASLSPEFMAELGLRSLEHSALACAEVGASAVDVERQHRHRRAVRLTLSAAAVLRRSLEGSRDLARILRPEHVSLEVERVALFGHACRPAPR